MAEEKAAESSSSSSPSGQKPILLIALAVINMLVIVGVGVMLYLGKKKEAAEPSLQQVIKNESEEQKKEHAGEHVVEAKVIPLETFLFNVAGSRGTRLGKINLELEVEGEKIAEEIEKRKANIRDNIFFILSSKTFEELSSSDGKTNLKNELRDRLNSMLVQGKIINIYFTEYIYQ